MANQRVRQYYDRRLEAWRTDPAIVHAVHEAIGQGAVRRTDAMAIIEAVLLVLGSHGKEEHNRKFDGTAACVKQMLHAGVVGYQTNATTSPLSVPIPSMATHIANLLSAERRSEVASTLKSMG